MAFQHFAAHAGNQGFQLVFFTLLGDRVERFFQRDGGGDQRRKLAGQEGEIAGVGAADKARLPAAAGCRGDVQRQPALSRSSWRAWRAESACWTPRRVLPFSSTA